MQVHETEVEDFLSLKKTQFIIPVYQRNYDWSTGQCKQLLDDILEVGSNSKINAHFIGSIVYIHEGLFNSSAIKELTVIDGQQRLTTLTLIYLVLHRLVKKLGNAELVDEIYETYLTNKFVLDAEKLKLRPTENNDKALKFLLRSDDNEDFSDFSRLIDNFNYFKKRIIEENHQVVLKGLSKLKFVDISLDNEKDNPQRIFESLNSKGLKLSEADLIRNYILMGLKREDQNRIYEDYWEVIEKLAIDETSNTSRVSDYVRDYLTLVNKKITNQGHEVYFEFKTKYPTTSITELENNLKEVKKLAKHYNKLINPKNETDKEIRSQLEYINRLEVNVSFPFLMKVYDDFTLSVIDKDTFLKVLDLIQSFIVRRFILESRTSGLNKIFMGLYDKVKLTNYLRSIEQSLLQRSNDQKFPKDSEFIASLKTKVIYKQNSKKLNYFLERLETFENPEKVAIAGNTDITIEHIFPQNPHPIWKKELSDDEYYFIKDNYLHTISNLTLSGNNNKLGNKSFKEKRDLEGAGYKDSRLWMNKYLSTLDKFDKAAIEERFNQISKRALKIWKYPEIGTEIDKDNRELNIFDADDPTYKKLEYVIFFDDKIEIEQTAKLYLIVFKKLFELEPETFFISDLGKRISLTKNPISEGSIQLVPINDTYYIQINFSSKAKFDRIKQALTLLDFEDELIIKYADDT